MISEENQTIAIGPSLDYKKIVNKVIEFLDAKVDYFPAYLKNSIEIRSNEKAINGCLATYLNGCSFNSAAIETFRFYFEKDTQVEKSNYEPDFGVMFANQTNRGKVFFHIECKRLPARDRKHEQEYVHGKLGGIQRFKDGNHGSNFLYSAMIGYVEEGSFQSWYNNINSWIDELIEQDPSFWNVSDKLIPRFKMDFRRFVSSHKRRNREDFIQLYHFWITIPKH
jgi:hypothetical protein